MFRSFFFSALPYVCKAYLGCQPKEGIDKESLELFLQDIKTLKEAIAGAVLDEDVTFTVSASW